MTGAFGTSPGGLSVVALASLVLFCGGASQVNDEPADTVPAEGSAERTSADVAVTPAIRVVPSSATIRADGRLRLVATPEDSETDRESFTWTTSNAAVATVDDSGFVRGVDVGTATINAAKGGRVGSAVIRVLPAAEATAASPAASLEGSGATREPAGYSVVTDRPFRELDDAGWRFNRSSHYSIEEDHSAPVSCCTVARASYRSGRAGGNSPVTTWYSFASEGYTELYLSFWLKLSDNWQGHSSGVNKIGFVWIHGDASVYFSAQGRGAGPLQPHVRLQAVPGGARNLPPNLNSRPVRRGEWHHWEVQLVSNSGGGANGVVRLWLDGVPVSAYTDVTFASASQERTWEHVYWMPIWGGVGDTVRDDMHMFISHLYASGR